jgi:class 3 adenylate cyclase
MGPEEARCGYELASVLARSGGDDRERLISTLRATTALADQLGMLPLVTACQALFRTAVGTEPELRASSEVPPRTRVILVSDLVGSTELNVKAGDAVWVDRLGRHDRIVRSSLRRHDGVEFKHTGDGVCAWFDSAPAAVDCADDIRRELAAASAEDPDLALIPRFGLACGQPIGVGDDLFGIAVTLAARLCAAAPPDVILASAEVGALARDSGVDLVAAGERGLKGFPEPVPVFSSGPPEANAPA